MQCMGIGLYWYVCVMCVLSLTIGDSVCVVEFLYVGVLFVNCLGDWMWSWHIFFKTAFAV